MNSAKKWFMGLIIIAGFVSCLYIFWHFHSSENSSLETTMKEVNHEKPRHSEPKRAPVPKPKPVEEVYEALSDDALKKKLHEINILRRQMQGETVKGKTNSPGDAPALAESFQAAIPVVAPSFAEVKAGYKDGVGTFTNLTMNRLGAGFDGVRFKNETDQPLNVVWAFAHPRRSSMRHWYIAPVNGTMNGFRNFNRGGNDYLNAPWNDEKPPYTAIIQPLVGLQIKPGREYIMWFMFAKADPEDFYFAINLLPKGTKMGTRAAQEAALGLKRKSNPGADPDQ